MSVYTQTTDVEGEINGFYTYDRKVLKVDADRVRKANVGQIDLTVDKAVMADAGNAGSREKAPEWRYTFDRPSGDAWVGVGFDDKAWKIGRAGFGKRDAENGPHVNTDWTTGDVWLRRTVEITAADLADPLVWRVRHDEDVEIYVNGVRALGRTGHVSDYIDLPLTDEARRLLKPGPNVIAVHCLQKVFGQFVDVGLVRRTLKPNSSPREDAAGFPGG